MKKMGAIPSGKLGKRFPPLSPLQNTGFIGDIGEGGGRRRRLWTRSGQEEGRKERGVGEKGLARAHVTDLVAPARMAR